MHEAPVVRKGRTEQIAENVFAFLENQGSNDSMVVTDEGIVLIDTPYLPTDAVNWRRFVESRGRVRYIVNTDHHLDHSLGNIFLEGTVIAHEGTRRRMGGGYYSPDFLRSRIETLDPQGLPLCGDLVPRLPDITINDRMALYLGGVTFELMHFKGHTSNNLMVYLPDRRILFSGDNVCEGMIPSFQEPTVFELLDTLDHIAAMDVDLIVPGHGKLCTRDRARTFRAEIEDLVDRVGAEMRKGVPRETIVETIRYEDKIHFPQSRVEELQRVAMGNIYDSIMARERMP